MATVAELEFAVVQKGLCAVQEEIHTPGPKGDIDTHFFQENTPVTWYSSGDSACEQNKTSETEVKYTMTGDVAFLYKVQMHQYLPAVRVRESHTSRIRIAYSSYPAIAIIVQARLSVDKSTPMIIPGLYYNVMCQYFRKDNSDGEIRRERERLGHVPALLDWNSELPSYHLRLNQPFFFAQQTVDALPINLSGKRHPRTEVVQTITFRNKLHQILRMQENVDGAWKDILGSRVKDYMQFLECTEILPTPEMRVWHSVNTNEETDQYRCERTGKYNRIYSDIVDATESCLTRSPSHLFDECTMPVRSLFWGLENQSAANYNNYNNFTTDREAIDDGKWPINTSTLAYGTKVFKFQDMSVDYFLDNHPFPSDPMDVGLLAYGIGVRPSGRVDVGVPLAYVKGRLNVDMSGDASPDDSYNLRIFCHVTRKVMLTKAETGRYLASVSQEATN